MQLLEGKQIILQRMSTHLPCSYDLQYEMKEHAHLPRKFSGDTITFHGKGTGEMRELIKQQTAEKSCFYRIFISVGKKLKIRGCNENTSLLYCDHTSIFPLLPQDTALQFSILLPSILLFPLPISFPSYRSWLLCSNFR